MCNCTHSQQEIEQTQNSSVLSSQATPTWSFRAELKHQYLIANIRLISIVSQPYWKSLDSKKVQKLWLTFHGALCSPQTSPEYPDSWRIVMVWGQGLCYCNPVEDDVMIRCFLSYLMILSNCQRYLYYWLTPSKESPTEKCHTMNGNAAAAI